MLARPILVIGCLALISLVESQRTKYLSSNNPETHMKAFASRMIQQLSQAEMLFDQLDHKTEIVGLLENLTRSHLPGGKVPECVHSLVNFGTDLFKREKYALGSKYYVIYKLSYLLACLLSYSVLTLDRRFIRSIFVLYAAAVQCAFSLTVVRKATKYFCRIKSDNNNNLRPTVV